MKVKVTGAKGQTGVTKTTHIRTDR